MQSKIKIAICGIGSHCTNVLIPSILACSQSEIQTFVTRSQDKASSLRVHFPNAKFVDSVAAIDPNEIDLVISAASPAYNADVMKLCDKIGLRSFLEKPLYWELQDLSDISNPDQIQVGYNLAFADLANFISKLSAQHGEIDVLNISYCTNKPKLPLWNLDSLAQSFVYAILCHPVHFAASVQGFTELVSVNAQSTGSVVHADVGMRSPRGGHCYIRSHNYSPNFSIAMELLFSDGFYLRSDGMEKWAVSQDWPTMDGISLTTAQIKNSTFDLSRDPTGFVNQMRSLIEGTKYQHSVDTRVSLKAAIETNRLLGTIVANI